MGSGTPGRAASTATTTRRPFSSAAEAIVARAPEADIWSGPRPFSSLVHSVHLDAESRGTYFLPILRPVTPCLQTSALLCGEPTSVPRIDCLKSAPWGVDQSCLGPLCLLREDWERSGGREAPGLLGHTGDPEVIRVCTMEFPAGRGPWFIQAGRKEREVVKGRFKPGPQVLPRVLRMGQIWHKHLTLAPWL